jgi:Rrf2 family protein
MLAQFMLSKTTISALRALVYLARREEHACLSPRRIAEALDESPTYLAKALRHLVKTGILRAEKGVHGGVRFGRPPEEVTLLAVVEACQGAIAGDFSGFPESSPDCGFHRAVVDLHTAVREVLSRWTLAQFLDAPCPVPGTRPAAGCLMRPGQAS